LVGLSERRVVGPVRFELLPGWTRRAVSPADGTVNHPDARRLAAAVASRQVIDDGQQDKLIKLLVVYVSFLAEPRDEAGSKLLEMTTQESAAMRTRGYRMYRELFSGR
jgi:hypothetical protein